MMVLRRFELFAAFYGGLCRTFHVFDENLLKRWANELLERV